MIGQGTMTTPGMISNEKKTAHLAQLYSHLWDAKMIPVSVDDKGNVLSLVPAGHNDTSLMTFSRPEFTHRTLIGMYLGTKTIAYEDTSAEHSFPDAFRDPKYKEQPARLTIPTLKYDSGRRVYFFRVRTGPTPLPIMPSKLKRLSSSTLFALPTPDCDSHNRWEIEPTDYAYVTLDPFMPDRPEVADDFSHRMGRVRSC